ncbi:hypothetical protein LJC67_06790 [Bacteroidales bacterium OttesenSCG-928-A14]|nr:hypothetical protein [Bacteroidales bacterium OttesenSCG-928-A14]
MSYGHLPSNDACSTLNGDSSSLSLPIMLTPQLLPIDMNVLRTFAFQRRLLHIEWGFILAIATNNAHTTIAPY